MTTSLTTDYVGNKIYENGALKRILIDGGYIEGGKYHYYLTDHLGNNRAVTEASGIVIQQTQYYPFGMAFAERTGGEKQPYKYNNKELDTKHGLNMYDYSARYLDNAVPRFTSVDPLAEKYYSISPYVYVGNNPMRFIDPSGDSIRVYTETVDGGHAWMSVGEGDDMVVYSYNPNTRGSKDRKSGDKAVRGNGVVYKYTGTKAQSYLKDKAKDTDMYSVTIADVSDNSITDVLNDIIRAGVHIETMQDTADERVNGETQQTVTGITSRYNANESYGSYNLITNNCTTFVSDVLNNAGSKVLQSTSTRTITNRSHGDVYSVTSSSLIRYVIPRNLRRTLNNAR